MFPQRGVIDLPQANQYLITIWPCKYLIACALPDLSNSTSFGNRNVATKIECLFKTPQNIAFPISITLFFWYETSFLSNTEMKSSSACLGLFPCIYFCLQYSTYDWLLFPELYGFLGIALLISSSLIFRAVNAYLAAVLSQFAAGNTPQETSMHLLAQLNMLQWHTPPWN